MTAVEFLMKFCLNDLPIQQWNKYNGLFQQAKEMEKHQIIDAYWGGLNGSINDYSESKQVGSEIIDIKYGKGADQYYNETYGSKGSDETLKDYHIVDTNEMVSSQTEISDTEVEFAGTNAWVEYNFNVSDDAESFYSGWKLAIKWYREQLKQRQCKR